MESPGCSSGSMRLSYGAPASPMHLEFYVTASPSTLPSSSPSLEATLHSPPATGTRWQWHSASPTLGHRHQAAAAGSTSGRRHWNMTTNTAYAAAIEAATRRRGGAEGWQLGPTSKTSGDASLTSIPSVVVA
ncbi:hypothetical protein CK203_093924 [Vitis vinifera]|uniref:Uncharacterized protein n=1 Tax=Vitis vinifera TaxID=29760 RepID=A0A438CTD3_VITVI|nr:hypothetical protein CK203_093924 [Vitis vinifera]